MRVCDSIACAMAGADALHARLAAAEQESGLSAKARIADLTSRREYVLRTLAALEKAQRAMSPA